MKLGTGLTLALIAAGTAWPADLLNCGAVPGWTQKGEIRSYVADNLFEYMNGNAEGYLIYSFVKMRGITCVSGEDTLLIDIFEMADTDGAYGVFTANRDPQKPAEKIGMAGQIGPRKAIFAKGKYFVESSANPAQDYSEALRKFAVYVEKGVEGGTALPDALGWFPDQGLSRDNIRLVPESVLGLRLLKRGYVAQYDAGKAFLVFEGTPESAQGVMQKLRTRFGETTPTRLGDEAFQHTDKYLGKMCVFRKGRYIGGFANIPEGQDPVARASALASRMP